MAVTVGEIMNRELYATHAGERAANVLHDLMDLEIGGCPVVDDDNRPIGVVSVRDLYGSGDALVADRMTSPPLVLHESAPIREAARLMAEAEVHRIVVVDADRAVGIPSSPERSRTTTWRPDWCGPTIILSITRTSKPRPIIPACCC